MVRSTLSLLLFAALTTAAPLLHADTYSFTISTAAANSDPATTFVASGTLTGSPDPFTPAAFDIATITGSADGYNFLGVVDPGAANSQNPVTDQGFTFNNVLYTAPGTPHADPLGFLVYLDSPIGTSLAHVYSTPTTPANPGGYEVDVLDPNDPSAITPFAIDSFSITPAIPEPSTLFLVGTGLAGLSGLIRRKLTL